MFISGGFFFFSVFEGFVVLGGFVVGYLFWVMVLGVGEGVEFFFGEIGEGLEDR